MNIVISLGGSIVFQDAPNIALLKKLAKSLPSQYTYGIVVGGGKVARQYVNAARELKENNYELDQLAITVTKANARLVKAAIPGAVFFEDVGRATSYLAAGGRMVVMGGTTPGQTTDAVAALLAEDCGASRFVNLSNVPAIYTEDPAKDKHATRIPHMTHREFVSFVEKKVKQTPGQNFIVDQIAAKVLARSNIDAHFVKGTDMKQVVAAIKGQKHNGTVISG